MICVCLCLSTAVSINLKLEHQVNRDRLQRFLGQKNEGFFVNASEEQIRALTDQAGEKGSWPFGESTSTINILHHALCIQISMGRSAT